MLVKPWFGYQPKDDDILVIKKFHLFGKKVNGSRHILSMVYNFYVCKTTHYVIDPSKQEWKFITRISCGFSSLYSRKDKQNIVKNMMLSNKGQESTTYIIDEDNYRSVTTVRDYLDF